MGILRRLFGKPVVAEPVVEKEVKSWDEDRVEQLRFALEEIKGAALPREFLPRSWSGVAQWQTWDTESAITKGYLASTWVYVCISKNANAVASVPWCVEVRNGRGDWERAKDHPLQSIMDRPNEYWSRQRLLQNIVAELMLSGNSLVAKVRVDDIPVELFTLRPNRVQYVPSRDIHCLGYTVNKADGSSLFVGSRDVVHIQLPNPNDIYWGASPMQAASKAVDVDREASNWQKCTLQNLLVPPGVFSVAAAMKETDYIKAKDYLRNEYQGAINARRPLLLGGDIKWNPLAIDPLELDFLQTRRMNREEICAIFGVPTPIAGIMDNSTYNNYETARDVWWEDYLVPLIELITGAFNAQLVSEWGEDVRLVPDLSHVPSMAKAFDKRVDRVTKLCALGVPFNKAAEVCELGIKIDGGDVGYISAGMVPMTSTGYANSEMVDVLPPPRLTLTK